MARLHARRLDASWDVLQGDESLARWRRRRALHLGDDLVSLLDEGGEEARLVYRAYDLPLAKDDAPTFAAGDAQVRHPRLAGTVDHAAHDGDGERLPQPLEVLLYLVGQGNEIDLDAAAGGAGHDRRAALAQAQRAEDVPADG